VDGCLAVYFLIKRALSALWEKANMKSAKRNGVEITTGEAGTYKAIQDGVSVDTLLLDDLTPYGLCLTFNWPVSLPKEKIDFVLISYNKGHSFMGAFRYGTFGLDMAYSENSNPDLINPLSITRVVTIKEISEDNQREYECELKHAVEHDSSIVIDLIESDVAQFENAPQTPFNEGFTD
jgi:hypothetical protein